MVLSLYFLVNQILPSSCEIKRFKGAKRDHHKKQEFPMVAMFVLYRTSHTSFIQSNNSLYLPSFRGEDFLNFSPSETRIAHGDHIFVLSG
jgi:hypothetical protein